MALLSVTHAHHTTCRKFAARGGLQSLDCPHDKHIAPFTSKKRVLLLIVLIHDLVA